MTTRVCLGTVSPETLFQLASSLTEIYRDKFGWKWKADSEIFEPRIFVPELEKHAGRFTGNDFENRRTAGAAVLRFLAE